MTIEDFFQANPRVALGFSGGVDSSYLLYAALKSGAEVRPYYVKTVFQPEFELRDAQRLCAELNTELTVLSLDILACRDVSANPVERCYYCKKEIFSAIKERAAKDGFTVLLDGTNASDELSERPGAKALDELRVLSPLRICGITKERLRALSREAGLFTWNKSAYACLATRIPSGEQLSADKLTRVEKAENELFAMGFRDFRVRTPGGQAKLQFIRSELGDAYERFAEINDRIGGLFSKLEIDPNGRGEREEII